MGTFADFYGTMTVPEGRIPELTQYMLKLLEQGGIMDREWISLYRKKIILLSPLQQNDKGKVVFDYNYFDDDPWEAAAYDTKTGKLVSNKIGWGDFAKIVLSAYLLLEFYTEEYSLTGVNGEIAAGRRGIGWLNHLFHEAFVNRRLDDPWKIYSVLRKENPSFLEENDLLEFCSGWRYSLDNLPGVIRYAAIVCPELLEKEVQHLKNIIFHSAAEKTDMEANSEARKRICFALLYSEMEIKDYLNRTESEKLKKAASHIINFEESSPEEMLLLNFGNLLAECRASMKCILEAEEATKERSLERLIALLKDHEEAVPNGPAWECVWLVSCLMPKEAVLKQLADVFELDFWELLETVGQEMEDKSEVWISSIPDREEYEPVEPMSTAEFLKFPERGLSEDDRAYYWRPDGDVMFSEEMLQWLNGLGRELNEIEEQEGVLIPLQDFLEQLVNTLDHINEIYQRVYCFEESFYYLIAHMHQRRVQAVLLQLQRLAEREREEFLSFQEESTSYWNFGGKTYHPSRLKLKRYLAVLGNPWLRTQWLGI